MGPMTLARGWNVLNGLVQLRPTLGAIGFNSSKAHGIYIYIGWLSQCQSGSGWKGGLGDEWVASKHLMFPFCSIPSTPASVRRTPSVASLWWTQAPRFLPCPTDGQGSLLSSVVFIFGYPQPSVRFLEKASLHCDLTGGHPGILCLLCFLTALW